MEKINNEMLEALFSLSHFELKEEERQLWQDDLNHWIEFFNMEAYQSPNNVYRAACTGSEGALRDDKIEPSLEIKTLKGFCPRFLDGFVALPSKNGNDGE